MALKFKIYKKGSITQRVNQNAVSAYADQKMTGHSGVDWWIGHKKPVSSDNAGYAYKVFTPFQLPSNWTGVHLLCPTDDPEVFMEILMGHFIEVGVKQGDWVEEEQYIGKQGNYGNVWGNPEGFMRRITVEEQRAGTTDRGSHVHEGWRPVRKVAKKTKGEFYLFDDRGRHYKDSEGNYYEIIEKNNGINGHIDPFKYEYTKDDLSLEFREVITEEKPDAKLPELSASETDRMNLQALITAISEILKKLA